jgi:hypothetical protein
MQAKDAQQDLMLQNLNTTVTAIMTGSSTVVKYKVFLIILQVKDMQQDSRLSLVEASIGASNNNINSRLGTVESRVTAIRPANGYLDMNTYAYPLISTVSMTYGDEQDIISANGNGFIPNWSSDLAAVPAGQVCPNFCLHMIQQALYVRFCMISSNTVAKTRTYFRLHLGHDKTSLSLSSYWSIDSHK